MMKFLLLSFLYIFALRFIRAQSLNAISVDSTQYCSEVPDSLPPLPKCDSTSTVTHDWEDIRIDCSMLNITISYSNYLGSVEDVDERLTQEIRLECSHQSGKSNVTCSYTGTHMSSASDTFTFGNLGAAKLLPGSMCFVSGCYKNEIAGESDLYVKTPITECTIQGMPSSIIPSTTALPRSTALTPSSTFITSSVAYFSVTTTMLTHTTVPIKESSITTTSTTIHKDRNSAGRSHDAMNTLQYTSLSVILILFGCFVPLVFLSCVKKQRARARKTLLVLNEKDMEFDPNHVPLVCIEKPSFSFSHRMSVVSADLIQNLRLEDEAIQISLEESGLLKLAATDELEDTVPPHSYAVHSSTMLNVHIHMDGSNDILESNADYIESVGLPGTSPDNQMDSSDSKHQLILEDKMYQSITHDSLSAQTNTFKQGDTLDTAVYSDLLQPDFTSDNKQVTVLGSLTEGCNLDGQEPSSTSDYQTSDLTQIPSFSNVPTTPDDIIRLDLPANNNAEYNEDSLSQPQGYIITFTLQNNQQTQLTSMADTLCTQPHCSPTAMLDNFEDNMNDLGALDVDWSLVSGQLPPMSQINTHNDENLKIDITNECNREITKVDVDGCDHTGQPPLSSVQDDEDDEHLALDSDKGSMVSVDLAGDISGPQNYTEQLEIQERVRASNATGYFGGGSSYIEGNVQVYPISSDLMSPPSHSFQSKYELGECQTSPNFTSDSSPYFLGMRAGDPTFGQCHTQYA